MKGLIFNTLSTIGAQRVDYGDCRIVRRLVEDITVKNNVPQAVKYNESLGMGIRLLVDGSWGFAATPDLDSNSIMKAVKQAVAVARAARTLPAPQRVVLTRAQRSNETYKTPYVTDPFSVSVEDKLGILISSTERMQKTRGISIAQAFYSAVKEEKKFGSTEGSFIEQTILYCGGGIIAYAIDGGEVQHRTYPCAFRGNFHTSGWEFFKALDLPGNAARVADEAIALLKAPPCPAGQSTILLVDDQLALQVHESIGHPIELDRVLGYEASFAGTSFLKPEMRGSFRYGSPRVNICADATSPGGLGTFGFDDEGVQARRSPIIVEGIFTGFLSSRETAGVIGMESNGTMRADGWSNFPLIRMTNINLEPGEWKLKDLISDTKSGFLLRTNKSWSIDDRRVNFQFSTELAQEIKNGKLGRIYKNPVYTGTTWDFWRSCDAVCDADSWNMWGTPNCGKGEPMQVMYVGHGVSPARFRNVRIGSAGNGESKM